MLKNVTLPEALVLIACIAATVIAYKLFDSTTAAAVVASVGMTVNFMLGRPHGADAPAVQAPDTKPEFKVYDGGKGGQ